MLNRGKKKVGVRVAIELVSLENIPSWCAGRSVAIGWRRGGKKENSGESTPAKYDPEAGKALFSASTESSANENFVFSLRCSLYKNKKTHKFEEKNIGFTARVLPAEPPITLVDEKDKMKKKEEDKKHKRHSSISTSLAGDILGKTLFNLSTAVDEHRKESISKEISIGNKSDSPILRINVKSYWEKVDGKKLVKASESKKAKKVKSSTSSSLTESSSNSSPALINIAGTEYCMETSDEITEASSSDLSEFTDDDESVAEITETDLSDDEDDTIFDRETKRENGKEGERETDTDTDTGTETGTESDASETSRDDKREKKSDKKQKKKRHSHSSSRHSSGKHSSKRASTSSIPDGLFSLDTKEGDTDMKIKVLEYNFQNVTRFKKQLKESKQANKEMTAVLAEKEAEIKRLKEENNTEQLLNALKDSSNGNSSEDHSQWEKIITDLQSTIKKQSTELEGLKEVVSFNEKWSREARGKISELNSALEDYQQRIAELDLALDKEKSHSGELQAQLTLAQQAITTTTNGAPPSDASTNKNKKDKSKDKSKRKSFFSSSSSGAPTPTIASTVNMEELNNQKAIIAQLQSKEKETDETIRSQANLIENLRNELEATNTANRGLEQVIAPLEAKIAELETQLNNIHTVPVVKHKKEKKHKEKKSKKSKGNTLSKATETLEVSPPVVQESTEPTPVADISQEPEVAAATTAATTATTTATATATTTAIAKENDDLVVELQHKIDSLSQSLEERDIIDELVYASELTFEEPSQSSRVIVSTVAETILERLEEKDAFTQPPSETSFVFLLIKSLKNHIKNIQRDEKALSYWLSTCCSVQHMLHSQKQLKYTADPLVVGVKGIIKKEVSSNAELSQQFQEGMEQINYDAFTYLLQITYQKLEQHLVMAFILDTNECILTLDLLQPKQKSENHLDSIVRILTNVLALLTENHIFDRVINTFFNQLFYYINARLFNQIIQRTEYCSPTTGFRTKFGLSQLVDWVLQVSQKSPQRFLNVRNQLIHITQTANMLVALTSPSSFFSSTDVLNSSFSALNTHQINHIVTNITPDEFSKPDTNELKRFTQKLLSQSPSWQSMPLNLDPYYIST